MSKMQETSQNSNLTKVVKDMIDGDVIEANELVCNGKIKASLYVNCSNGKQHVIEIVEDDLVHYLSADGSL